MKRKVIKLYHLVIKKMIQCLTGFQCIEKKVIFDSFGGNQYSDSPRAISEQLHELYPDYTIVWALKNDACEYNLPQYVKVVKYRRNRIKFLKEIGTSFCYVTNNPINDGVCKRTGQLFIQTWHGDRPIKKFLYDVDPNEKIISRIMDNELTDYCIAASDIGEKAYRSAFRYSGQILKIGMPRNDNLIVRNIDRENEVRKQLGIHEDTKVLLYAPTYRDNVKGKQNAVVDLKRILDILQGKGEKWTVLIRAHVVSAGIEFKTDDPQFIDATQFPDMADLLTITDMLITDYSSCAGDFILTGKATILAAFDIDEYGNSCRELQYDLSEAGYIVASNQDELENIIKRLSPEDYKKNCEKLCRFFGVTETGHSATDICNIIDKKYSDYIQNKSL